MTLHTSIIFTDYVSKFSLQLQNAEPSAEQTQAIQDYGCVLGDDHRELEASGLNINAWDPVLILST
ncbi:hypothetical protein CEX98_18860 [Pseudoalteromonas piscicida]|uniref:Uncharacterized protein n=1 Tax=Pseudoalteromonas piscicida TaxID=43662 RepID=A0A2A5JL88_PSEO7|nr:hypothetical protein CEX98_18860 [Pseudoalteromonas piscicida]